MTQIPETLIGCQLYSLSPEQLGTTVSMAIIGTSSEPCSPALPGQKYGGREVLLLLCALGALPLWPLC